MLNRAGLSCYWISSTLLAVAPLMASHAMAATGWQVKQTVTSKSGADSVIESQVWQIDAQNFRLDSDLSGRQINYIFNSRNLYACLRVTDEKFFSDDKASALPASVRYKLKTGVCLAMPINIAASFLISPHSSISALDITDSLQLTLNLDKYTSKANDQTSKIAQQECTNTARDYQYTYFAYNANQSLVNNASEKYCSSPTINWRKPFWKQLSRTLLQQKNGRNLRKEIDLQKLENIGIDLSKEATYTISDGKKSIRNIQVSLNTSSIEQREIDSRVFVLPAGFEILSSTKERTLVADNSPRESSDEAPKASSEKTNSKANPDEKGALEMIPSILKGFLLLPF